MEKLIEKLLDELPYQPSADWSKLNELFKEFLKQ